MGSGRKNSLGGLIVAACIRAVAAGGVVGLVTLAAPALAQVQSVEPYYGITTAEKTALQCFHTETAYTVTEFPAGQILRVDGEGPRWARVGYPAARVAAFVRAEDGKAEGTELKLANPSRLWAINAMRGFAGSWKALLDAELPAGTILKLAEPQVEKDATGAVIAYRVVAPEGARGYVDAKSLRRATDAEVEAYRQQLAAAGIALPGLGKGTTTASKPEDRAKPEEGAKKNEPIASKPEGTDLTEPIAKPSETKVTPGPVASKPTGTAPGGAGNVAPEQARRVGTLEQLEETFQAVYKQPAETAEFDAIIGEYQRLLDTTASGEFRRRQQVEQRLETLKIKRDIRDRLRALKAEQTEVDANMAKVRDAVAEVEKTRVYTIIGQLQPSTVYDGQRLPLMFRVQSVGDVTPRTLGYLKPSPELNLESKVGLVIGVVGEAQLDPALHLNVITPVRVDTLKPGETTPANAPSNTPGK